jgi:hypothetical protein
MMKDKGTYLSPIFTMTITFSGVSRLDIRKIIEERKSAGHNAKILNGLSEQT